MAAKIRLQRHGSKKGPFTSSLLLTPEALVMVNLFKN